MKVFLSWSGERSRLLAEAMRDWLPNVIQAVEPWMSAADIEKGTRWGTSIAVELEQTKVGIVCLTAENIHAPWILFEAGALSKTLDNTFVCPYLLDIGTSDVEGPLAQFQLTLSHETDTRKLIHTINRALATDALPSSRVDKAFETYWPDLNSFIQKIPKPTEGKAARRLDRELLEEILESVRGFTRSQLRVVREFHEATPGTTRATKFDEYGEINFNDEMARLDNFAIQLQNEPGVGGYIICYSNRDGEGLARAERAAEYLTKTRGIKASRLKAIGSLDKASAAELWLGPPGVMPPLRTTIFSETARPLKSLLSRMSNRKS